MKRDPLRVNECGVVILAGGASSRLGRPKQLLVHNGNNLLGHAIQAALYSDASPVVVVLGADAERIRAAVSFQDIHVVDNAGWADGMASSLTSGLTHLLEVAPSTDGVIIMVCDQPFVSATLLNELISTQRTTGQAIVTSQYEKAFGPPTLFHKIFFPELLKLEGDAGAKKIVGERQHDTASVIFKQGEIDIDTERDYQNLKDKN